MPDKLSTVNLLFKTHLDLGFTAPASKVLDQYMMHFIPRAMETSRRLRESGGSQRMIWTTGSWLIRQYLEQADSAGRSQMEQSIQAADISWHALPFTTHSELMDEKLFCYGLSISKKLDRLFGRTTIAGKMTDVPGHTIAMVPHLAEAGVKMLHLGVNAASAAPDVPSRFIWRHKDGSEIIVLYDKDDYGGDLVLGDQLFKFIHTHDNLGPSSYSGVIKAWRRASSKHHCEVKAADLNHMASAALLLKDELPVIEQEIGDSWIHGAGTDPAKLASYRALSRTVTRMAAEIDIPDAVMDQLLCIPEHTWGLDEKMALADYCHYSPKALARLRRSSKCRCFEDSWKEQRSYLNKAVGAASPDLKSMFIDELKLLKPERPSLDGFQDCGDASLRTKFFTLIFDKESGAISFLRDNGTGRTYCSDGRKLGLFTYETFSPSDYRRFLRQYLKNLKKHWIWAIPDFTKPGMFIAGAKKTMEHPRLQRVLRKDDSFLLQLSMSDTAVLNYGAPEEIWLQYDFPKTKASLEITLRCFKKRACRLPEASWLSFSFDNTEAQGWTMDKMGSSISPMDVVSQGGRGLHGVNSGLEYREEEYSLRLKTIDAALTAFDKPSLLDFHNRIPDPAKGVHFNLHNNIWGTNFPMWYEEDSLYRFILDFKNEN
jgi:Domain of unknown function (DUF5054)